MKINAQDKLPVFRPWLSKSGILLYIIILQVLICQLTIPVVGWPDPVNPRRRFSVEWRHPYHKVGFGSGTIDRIVSTRSRRHKSTAIGLSDRTERSEQ